MVNKYKVITLCGSTRFKKEFLEVQKKLTLDGNIVISVGLFGHAGDSEVWENKDENTLTKTKKMLDDMHKHKIDMADEIFVIDVGGYIGKSTESEINYAKKNNKTIRYYSQEIASDVHEYAFQKLTPTVNADLTTYEDALDYVFCEQNKDIQNIAITGIYGSGKSSVIDTYERKYHKKFIHISLSHFEGVTNEESEDLLEKKIVNQLVQQVPVNLIPDTKFKIKKEIRLRDNIFQASIIVILAYLMIYFIKFKDFVDAANSGKYKFLEKITSKHAPELAVVLFTILLMSLLIRLLKLQKQKHIIGKVSVQGNEIDLADDKDDKSYFNRHMDEILYVLENITTAKGKYRFDGIIIEDLDRFEQQVDSKIFEKLRELCVLGNKRIKKNKGEGQPTLRFFYLLSDDTFLSKERTKFFDYIIPIIPFVDTSNAYAKIKDGLVQAGYEDKIDDHFLRGLSLYFDDYRLIKNILNEFQIYAKKLTNIEHNYNELLALIVYKNFFPKDFAELQLHSGYVYSLFDKRASIVKEKSDGLKDLLTDAKTKLTALNDEVLASEKELQLVKHDREQNKTNSTYNDIRYTEWEKTEYPRRLQAIRDKKSGKEKELREEIISLQTEIIHVSNKKFKDLVANDKDVFNINSNKGDENIKSVQEDKYFEIIRYLIISGYLDDFSYRDYMACFDENGMTISDKNFLIAVNNRTGKPYDYKLDNPELVYESLKDEDFLVPAIRNNMLIDYLVRYKKRTSFEKFAMQIKESSDVYFIAQYLRNTTCYENFVSDICHIWDGFLNAVISDSNQAIALEERQQVVLTSLTVCTNEEIKKQNENGVLKKYLEEDISSAACDHDKAETIAEKLNMMSVKIHNLNAQLGGGSLRQEVVENSLYEINIENMESILENELSCTNDDIENRFLSSLVNGDVNEVATYTLSNLADVVSIVVDNNDKQNDDQEIVQRISNVDIDNELISAYLKISETIIEDITSVNDKYWNILAEKHTFSEKSENILFYFEKYGLDMSLVKYLNEANIKGNIDFTSESDRCVRLWKEVYKKNTLSDETYFELVEQIGCKIDNFNDFNDFNLDEHKCRYLIEHNLIPMNPSTINLFRMHYQTLMCDFICSDISKYIALTKGAMFSIDEVKVLLEDSRVKEEDKIKLLSMTAEVISVKDKNLSDVVFKEILAKHFDVNDLQYLSEKYDKYNDECKNAIYKIMVVHKAQLISIADDISALLLTKIFSLNDLSLIEKANILDVLIQNKKPNDLIAKLLTATGENVLARLFVQGRSRMSPIVYDAGHEQLLTILKKNNIIEDFSGEEGKQFRIKRY